MGSVENWWLLANDKEVVFRGCSGLMASVEAMNVQVDGGLGYLDLVDNALLDDLDQFLASSSISGANLTVSRAEFVSTDVANNLETDFIRAR